MFFYNDIMEMGRVLKCCLVFAFYPYPNLLFSPNLQRANVLVLSYKLAPKIYANLFYRDPGLTL